jgi:hypothetical protein
MVVDEGFDVLQEVGEVMFGRLAATAPKSILAGTPLR